MTQELVAYFIQGDGEVRALPTEGLRIALDQAVQGSPVKEPGACSGNVAVYEFLHAMKQAMQAAKPLPAELA
jgi:hypothetical protein